MEKQSFLSKSFQPLFSWILMFSIFFTACNNSEKEPAEAENVVEIVTKNMDFQAPDTITSGWHTFRYSNNSTETHFFLLDKYPEGKTIEDAAKEVGPPFQKGMDLIIAGKPDEANKMFGTLPEWFSKVVFSGGSGLIGPGRTAELDLKIEPGYYVIECYVKMANGMFHSSMGMVKQLIVVPETATEEMKEIKPDVTISLSNENGMELTGNFKKGKQTVEVNFIDQKVYENFVGHDVNLVKTTEGADLNALQSWMNWVNPAGLTSPVPEGFTFLGGINDMPAGSKAYFSADLEPGEYVLIAEVPDAENKKLMKKFTIQ